LREKREQEAKARVKTILKQRKTEQDEDVKQLARIKFC
jgi:hypothetical protein